MATQPHFSWQFACPSCQEPLATINSRTLRCQQECINYPCIDGIWQLLAPSRQAYFAQFIREYEHVRQAEGRGSNNAAYYRRLPFAKATERLAKMWQIRAQSYQTLVDNVVNPLVKEKKRPLTILDLGAGNGWLSNQLAQQGHQLATIDLTINMFDGLGTHHFYETSFLPVQAEFERLPFLPQQADLIIFNASFHYATSYEKTLAEALRLLRPGGQVVVMDTAVYHNPTSGQQMVQEREAAFQQQYGFPSNALPSQNYLSYQQINELGYKLSLNWTTHWPIPHWRQTVRRWRAKLRRQREPAQFPLLIGKIEMPSLPRNAIS